MTQQKLSEHEKKVLFTLTEDALRTDAEISSRVDMRESTVGENRRKLLKNGHLEFINIPSFHKLGFEFITDIHKYSDPAIYTEIPCEVYRSFFRKNPGIFDVVLGDGYIGCTGVFKDYTNFLKFINEFELLLCHNGLSKTSLTYSLFPFDTSRCTNVFNFAPCLNRILDLKIPDPQSIPMKKNKREDVKLSNKEAKVFTEIIEYPMSTDADIANRQKRSRTGITEMRNNLLKKGLFSRVAIPSFDSLTFKLIAFVYMKFRPPISFEEKREIAGDDWWQQSILTMEKDTEFIASYPFRNKEEYNNALKQFIGPFREVGTLIEEPKIFLTSIKNAIDLLDNSYAPLIKKLYY